MDALDEGSLQVLDQEHRSTKLKDPLGARANAAEL